MARQRDLLVNFERMRREMDELFGDVWGEGWWPARKASGFSPRIDVLYCGEDGPTAPAGDGPEAFRGPKAVVVVEIPGVRLEDISLEVSGRELAISGERPLRETEGRVYQQVEIEAGPFHRVVQLNADVVAEEAQASYDDGILRVELPLRSPGRPSRSVPISQGE